MKRTTLLLLSVSMTWLTVRAEVDVFDKPARTLRHLQLLARMDAAHSQKDYEAMADASRQGVKLGTSDELWNYNLACSLALQGDTQAAFAALDEAIERGFADVEQVNLDPDLAALRDTDAFKERLARIDERRTRGPTRARLAALRPDAAMTAVQSSSNTLWSFEMGLFQTYVAMPPAAPSGVYAGPEAQTINGWRDSGTACGCAGLLYANRDGGTHPLDITRYPGLVRLACAPAMIERRLHIGFPNSLFSTENGLTLIPVIGHSSMGYLNSPYWRSQPRALCGDPRQLTRQTVFLLGNQLYFYPAYGDYDATAGDLFPANTPYTFAVVGATNAEHPFLDAAFAALAAFRPDTRAELTRTGLLMPTLQMLFRASQRTLGSPRDYLRGVAHPAAFDAANLDTRRLVQMAHGLTTNDLPPIVVLSVLQETQAVPDRDFFDAVRTERQFDSPLAIARVFRGAARTRTLDLHATCKRADARLHWVLLQGDPQKVAFRPCPTNSSLMSLTVTHHEPFDTPTGNGKVLQTSRVDVGVIAETPAGFSVPSLVSFYMLGNEHRAYTQEGRIASIDYTRRQGSYVDPLLSYSRNWKDTYRYDSHGKLTGWTRRRGLEEEAFTAYGHKVMATDSLGRATKAHVVRYIPRSIKSGEATEGIPDLAQMDDNIEVRYHYASDADFTGTPDLTSLTQETEPPATDL